MSLLGIMIQGHHQMLCAIYDLHEKFYGQVRCIGIIRDDKTLITPADYSFEEDDKIIMAGDPDELFRLNS